MFISMPKHTLDPTEQQLDHSAPGQVAVNNLRVRRGTPHPPGTWVEDSDIGSVSFNLNPPTDDRTPAHRMGYRIRHINGMLPGSAMIPDYDVSAITTSDGQRRLVFYWNDGATSTHSPIHFHLSVAAVDLGGNVGPATVVDVSDPPVLASPALVSPADGERLTIYPRTTTLAWASVPGARAYKVEVEMGNHKPSGIVWTPLCWRTVTDTSWTFDFVGSQPGRWRVTALARTGKHQASHPSPWRIFDYTPQVPKLPVPVLVAPPDGAQFSHYPRTTTLKWEEVAGASEYRVDIAHGNWGQSGDIVWAASGQRLVTGTSLTFDFVGSQPGRWRVTALDRSGTHQPSPSSPWRMFDYTRVLNSALASPTLISPADGERLTTYPRTTTLVWAAVPGASSYKVEVEMGNHKPSGIVWTPLCWRTVTDTSWTFDFVGCQPGRWRVTALDSTGAHAASPPGEWRGFSYSV